jgi:hypothetical protein
MNYLMIELKLIMEMFVLDNIVRETLKNSKIKSIDRFYKTILGIIYHSLKILSIENKRADVALFWLS